MTRPAEHITIQFDGERDVWAPTEADAFWNEDATTWTPRHVHHWFATLSKPRGLGKLLGPRMPFAISTALGAPAMRYVIHGGLVIPRWAALSRADEELLRESTPPEGCRLEAREYAVLLHFDEAEPLQLDERLGLIRCGEASDALHYYAGDGWPSERTPERFVEATNGADGTL